MQVSKKSTYRYVISKIFFKNYKSKLNNVNITVRDKPYHTYKIKVQKVGGDCSLAELCIGVSYRQHMNYYVLP